MRTAFPAAEVEQYEPLAAALDLPDLNDRHILAAALRGQATVIVTGQSARLSGAPVGSVRYQGWLPKP